MQITDTDLRTRARELYGLLLVRSDPGRIERFSGQGLTMTQVRVLYTLQTENGLAAGELAERLGVQPSTVTRIVDRLVQNKLVSRVVDEHDRRLVRHYLTEQGDTLFRDLRATADANLGRVFAEMSDEQIERIVEALSDLTEAIEAVVKENEG
jgi:DNA-binding MarR family transcriptional regulator